MKERVTFTVNGSAEAQKAVGDLLGKIRGFADELERFIKSHTIVNRDDTEYRTWLIHATENDPFIACTLSRQNDSGTVSFGFVVSRDDKMPPAKMVVAYLYPEFT
ncbi:MAG: hypothetical protein WC673_03510 [Candidatus Paceibacterota bacterium]|jgi:hypothetical protein